MALPLLAACSAAPAQDVLGSFFPSWLLCLAAGIVTASLVRLLLSPSLLDLPLPVAPLTSIALAVAVALALWLVWFGH